MIQSFALRLSNCSQLVEHLSESQRCPPTLATDQESDDVTMFTADRLHGRLADFLVELEGTDGKETSAGDPATSLQLYMDRERAQLMEALRQLLRSTRAAADALSGLTAPDEASEAFACALRSGKLPADWLRLQSASGFDPWFAAVRRRLRFLQEGWREGELRLLHVLRPQQLLHVLLRERRRDLKKLRLQVEVSWKRNCVR